MNNKFKINKNITIIHENSIPKQNILLGYIIPYIITFISGALGYLCITQNILIISISILYIIIIITIVSRTIYIRKQKPGFIFNNKEIIKAHYPPLALNALLSIQKENNEIKVIEQITEPSDCYMHISYKFSTSDPSDFYYTFGSLGFMFTGRTSKTLCSVARFDIEVYQNNTIIYKEDINYFENLYFSNPYNTKLDKSKFIQLAINDALQSLN